MQQAVALKEHHALRGRRPRLLLWLLLLLLLRRLPLRCVQVAPVGLPGDGPLQPWAGLSHGVQPTALSLPDPHHEGGACERRPH